MTQHHWNLFHFLTKLGIPLHVRIAEGAEIMGVVSADGEMIEYTAVATW